ncbi:class I SAM-dependent methyltransferase [Candidatus Gottesmanbacteria bacterium]|nr:class I SAM-dependent methyltransferase [Candidatus Gottesmanbacteria bacterium]
MLSRVLLSGLSQTTNYFPPRRRRRLRFEKVHLSISISIYRFLYFLSIDDILRDSRFMRLTQIKLFDLFYRAYRAWPRFYDSLTQLLSFGLWEKWQNRAFEDLFGKKILEIGVGPGSLLINMVKKGYSVTGIELQQGMAFEARRRVKQASIHVDILHQSVYHLPFNDEIFDCIVLTFVLAEIAELDRAIAEMKRVLKKGGKIIVIAGGMPQDKNLAAKILFKLVMPHTTLRLERDNKIHFEKHGFRATREDFGPFNMINKIVAIK